MHNNGGVTLFILICFIVFGILIVQVVENGQEKFDLLSRNKQLEAQNKKLFAENQQFKEELSQKNLELFNYEVLTDHYEYVGFSIKQRMIQMGIWESFDQDTRNLIQSLEDPIGMVPVTGFINGDNIKEDFRIKKTKFLSWVFPLGLIFSFLGSILFLGWRLSFSEQRPINMRVTKKEAETINYLRRNKRQS